ncbi:hypothetical protein MASR1M32_01230 [Rhodobacter sp.]
MSSKVRKARGGNGSRRGRNRRNAGKIAVIGGGLTSDPLLLAGCAGPPPKAGRCSKASGPNVLTGLSGSPTLARAG